jgi:hypothetical protein
MNIFHRKLRMLPIVALAISAAATSLAVQVEGRPDSEQVSTLLSNVKTQAGMLREDASTMESYTRTGGLNWKSHAEAVNRMRDHINEAGRQLSKLQEVRAQASPWQSTAITRIQPLLTELAANTEKAIQYINDNPGRLFMEPYKDYIEANADLSIELASMISDFVNYGDTKQRLESLAGKLELQELSSER